MEKIGKCVFCKSDVMETGNDFSCILCGNYGVSQEFYDDFEIKNGSFVLDFDNSKQSYYLGVLQGAIYESNLIGKVPYLINDNEDSGDGIFLRDLLLSVKIPVNPSEKLNKFLENLGNYCSKKVGKNVSIDYATGGKWSYAIDKDEFIFILEAAKASGYFSNSQFSAQHASIKLTMEAWEKIENLKAINDRSIQVFVAYPFQNDYEIYKEAIVQGVKDAKYKAICLKGMNFNDPILSKAIGEIKKSRFVIVDLTHSRNSVIFEAGYAIGKGIDVIFVINSTYWKDNKESLEFYVKNYNIRRYEDQYKLREIIKDAILERA